MTDVFQIAINEGEDWSASFTYLDKVTGLPVDLTGYTALMQVRCRYNGYDGPNVALSFSSTLAPDGSGIVLGTTNGLVQLIIGNVQTTGLYWNEGVWDLFLTSAAGKRTKLLEGLFTVMPSSTKP